MPLPRQWALAEVVQNTTRMGIASSKEIRHLGWLAGKVGLCVLICETWGRSEDEIPTCTACACVSMVTCVLALGLFLRMLLFKILSASYCLFFGNAI